jgi:hypothetical protein
MSSIKIFEKASDFLLKPIALKMPSKNLDQNASHSWKKLHFSLDFLK